MKSKISHLLYGASIIGAMSCISCAQSYTKSQAPISEVSFVNVHLDDSFWSPRIEINRTVSIPSAFKECEKNGRFDNFAIAAGLIKGEHRGDFSFDDTDPYKIIEGASYSLAVKYDAKLDHYLDSVINIIAKAQQPDGYLTTCVINKCTRLSGWWGSSRWEKINSHELYNSGHLYEAAVAHYRATGKRTLLDVAIKNADLVCKIFGPGENQKHVPSGHPIVEMALAKLYKVTGDKKYLDMAKYFVEETGCGTDGHRLSEYSQDHKPILQQDEIVGHAVRAGYLFSGVADVASLTGDTAYFEALDRIWKNMASKKLYITGGIGSRAEGEGFGPDYELNNQTAYCETCAAIANVYWNYRMFMATGNAKYMDIVERALYNGVISGVSLSGDKFFYDNPLESMGQHERQRWFGCACCPGNVTRFIASVPGYQYAVQSNDIYVNLYIKGSADIFTQNNKINLVQQTDYPWQGKISITVNPEKAEKFALRFRIPGWAVDSPVPTDLYSFVQKAKPFTISINGSEKNIEVVDGYATLQKNWEKGDVVEIDFPMDVKFISANEKVEDDLGKHAIQRGPIVYCLEGKDQNDSVVFNKSIPVETVIKAQYSSDLLNGVVILSGKAKQSESDGTIKDVDFKAIPYATWNNRGADQMAVWIPVLPQYAKATPQPTIASKAKTYVIQAPIQKDAPQSMYTEIESYGTNDQWDPKRSSDLSKPYQYWWLREGTLESLVYKFDKPYVVHKTEVYWLDFDHYDGDFRVPQSWTLFYKKAGKWIPVENINDYNVKKDCYNVLEFKPVETSELKIDAQLQKDVSGGIIEWKVE